MSMIQKTFIKAMREHFGYRQGEGLKEFSAEMKALTDKDRQDFTAMFREIGIEIVQA